MDTKTKKIALACFIGGVFFGATAFCVASMFWWLGILAGVAGGYLGYEFRAVLKAVPRAWQAAKVGMGDTFSEVIQGARRPHPFGCLSFFVTVGMSYLLVAYGFIKFEKVHVSWQITSLFIFWFMLWQIIWLIALCGIKGEFYFVPPDSIDKGSEESKKQIPLTYGNVAFCLARSFRLITVFFVWTIWKYLFVAIMPASRFLKHLFIAIHSNERVLCSVDGTLGGAAAFLWLAPTAETFVAKAAVVIFGGVLGAGLGVINYELVSKRWLHLVPQN